MKVTVKNLGVLKEAEVDIKPLTVFIGPNNAGKTWLAYTLGGVLGPYGCQHYTDAYVSGNVTEKYATIDNAIQQVLDEGSAKINLVQFADEYGESYFNNVGNSARNWLKAFIGTERISFDSTSIQINLSETKDLFLQKVLDSTIIRQQGVSFTRKSPLLTALKEQGKPDLFIYTSAEEDNILEKLPLRAIKELIVSCIFMTLHDALYPFIETFPAERTVLVTDPNSLQTTRQKEKPSFVRHFMSMVSYLLQCSDSDQTQREKSGPEVLRYVQLSQVLEKQILQGNIIFSTLKPSLGREILFSPAPDIVLCLAEAKGKDVAHGEEQLCHTYDYLTKNMKKTMLEGIIWKACICVHPKSQVPSTKNTEQKGRLNKRFSQFKIVRPKEFESFLRE